MDIALNLVGQSGSAEGIRAREIAFLLQAAYHEVGIEANLFDTHRNPCKRNVVIGAHLAEPGYLESLPDGSAILNYVRFLEDDPFAERLSTLAGKVTVWDPSAANRMYLHRAGLDVVKFDRVFVEEQARLYWHGLYRSTDVLVAGMHSPHQLEIVNRLRQAGLNVVRDDPMFSPERREQNLAAAKMVLDIPAPEERHSSLGHDRAIMNLIPVACVMNNRDIEDDWREELFFIDPLSVESFCKELVNKPRLLMEIAEIEFQALSDVDSSKLFPMNVL